jgi:hypothetical protein
VQFDYSQKMCIINAAWYQNYRFSALYFMLVEYIRV